MAYSCDSQSCAVSIRIDCRSPFCQRSECFWGSGGGGKKYVGKEGKSGRRLYGSYNPEGSAHGGGSVASNQPPSGSFDVGTPSPRRTSKQEPPRHDDRSLRTPPSITCGPQSAYWKLRYSPILPPSPLGPHLAMKRQSLEERMLDSVDSCGTKRLQVRCKRPVRPIRPGTTPANPQAFRPLPSRACRIVDAASWGIVRTSREYLIIKSGKWRHMHVKTSYLSIVRYNCLE